MNRLLVAALVVALPGACGGGHSTPARPVAPLAPPGRARAPHPAPAGAPAPSDAECQRLVGHMVDLELAELAPDKPSDPAALRAQLQARFAGACREIPRADYTCALAARSFAELEACDGYATRSSSTSNSKVAPGGITPPAPRSP